jgi:hypothetical protein
VALAIFSASRINSSERSFSSADIFKPYIKSEFAKNKAKTVPK